MTPLLLLPGLACDAALFRHQLPALQGLPGCSPVKVTDVHTRETTLPAMAARLLAEHPGPLALAGASMGGMLAMEVWRQAPDRVQGLALLGTTARADTPAQIRLRTEGIQAFEAGRMDEVLAANLIFAFHPAHGARLAADYGAMIRRAGVAQLVAQNRAVMAREDQRAALAGITCPLLVMGGDSDKLTPPECTHEIATAVPQAELALLADCGHMLTWEQPDAVTDRLCAWRRSLA